MKEKFRYDRAMASSRRSILSSGPAWLAMGDAAAAGRTSFADLRYSAGRLFWPSGSSAAACGRSGVRAGKREGDGASPAGTFRLVQIFYRPDRVAAPRSALPVQALQPWDGWVDDPGDPQYNRLVSLPYSAHHEEMWRTDGLYDLVVLIDYNRDPPIPGRGSAIFLHVARPDLAPTEGCIAIRGDVLGRLVGLLGPGSSITIEP